LTEYQIQLEILVNGQSGDNDVYWTSGVVAADAFDTITTGCTTGASTPVGAQASYTYWNGAGNMVDASDVELGVVAGAGSCDEVPDFTVAQPVTLLTNATTLNIPSPTTNDVMKLDFPAFNYDLDTISEGDVVSVRVTLLLAPCTTLISDTVCIGTFGCAAAVQECTFVINYLPNLTGPTWDSGFALANASARDANATVTFYEMDGDSGTWTTTIPAWDMEIFTNSLVSEITAISGSMGGSNCFATVHTDNTALHAFFMLWTDSLAQGSTASCCCQDCAQVLGTGSCP
jgi:hypothetical protein